MCLSPLRIKNPYLHIGDKGLNFLHDTVSAYINVPCGQCKQCVSVRQSWYNQRVQMESLRSHLFMITLTYNRNVPVMDYCSYKLMWPDWRDIQNMCKRIRSKGFKFRFWFCSEYGKSRKRPHFHGIIAVEKSDFPDVHVSVIEQTYSMLFLENWSVNVGSKRKPKYLPLLDYVKRRNKCTYDFHHVEPSIKHDDDVSFYLSKYILKYDKRTNKLLSKIRLDNSIDDLQTSLLISLIKPRSCMSKDFGDWKYKPIQDYIMSCLKRSPDLPQFFDLFSGRSSLLSPYYRKHLLPVGYMQSVYDRLSIAKDYYSLEFEDELSPYESNIDLKRKIYLQQKHKRTVDLISKRY